MKKGTMKVIVKNEWIYLRADFKNLTNEEHNFMEKCYLNYAPWCEFDEEGDTPLFNSTRMQWNEIAIKKVFEYADFYEIEVSEEVKRIQEIVSKKAEEERAKEAEERKAAQHVKELQDAIKKAYFKLQNGCPSCEHLKFDGYTHRCAFADRVCRKNKEEEEYEFYAKREERITGIEPAYFALPYPCVGCKYIVAAQKAQVELQELTKKQ